MKTVTFPRNLFGFFLFFTEGHKEHKPILTLLDSLIIITLQKTFHICDMIILVFTTQ